MSTVIPPEIEQYVEQVVATGRYGSPEQVVREAFRLLQEKDREFDQLRADVKAGFDELDRGEGIELDDAGLRTFFDDIQARGRRRYEEAKKALHDGVRIARVVHGARDVRRIFGTGRGQ